jgi:hypothetical protein
VDIVLPADPDHPTSREGRRLNDPAYRNRLYEFMKTRALGQAMGDALEASTESLVERFNATDKLANKGVHADIARAEAEFCALNTYLMAGEILRMKETAA